MNLMERLYKNFYIQKSSHQTQYQDLSKCGNTASPIISNKKVNKKFSELQKKDLSSKV